MNLADIVQRGWNAVAAGDFDTLVADYEDNMVFIMPGQDDLLTGKNAFRSALNKLGESRQSGPAPDPPIAHRQRPAMGAPPYRGRKPPPTPGSCRGIWFSERGRRLFEPSGFNRCC